MPDVSYFDLSDPDLDVTSPQVHAARDQSWYAETNWGWAVLRHAEVSEILRDRRFRQGNARWPAQNGIHSGLFSDWWQETLLSLEGDDHARIRRLLMPAFRNKTIAAMRPRFQELANELIDGFASTGRVELISQFAEPYAARIICVLLGLPEDNWHQVARWADDLGASFSIDVGNQVPRIEAALTGLYEYVGEVVADRREHPQDDLVTTLVQASADGDRLSEHELGVALVFLAFAGMATGQLWARRMAPGHAQIIGCLGMLVATGLIALALTARSLPALLAAAATVGIGGGMCLLAGLAMTVERIDIAHRGGVSSAYFAGLYTMLALPAIGVGALSRATDLITAGVVFAGLVSVVPAIVVIAELVSVRRGRATEGTVN